MALRYEAIFPKSNQLAVVKEDPKTKMKRNKSSKEMERTGKIRRAIPIRVRLSKAELICFKCGEREHLIKECKVKLRKCFIFHPRH